MRGGRGTDAARVSSSCELIAPTSQGSYICAIRRVRSRAPSERICQTAIRPHTLVFRSALCRHKMTSTVPEYYQFSRLPSGTIVAVVHMWRFGGPLSPSHPANRATRREEPLRTPRCFPLSHRQLIRFPFPPFPLCSCTQSTLSSPWSGHLPRTLPRWFSKRASGHPSACSSPDIPFVHARPAGPSLLAVPVTPRADAPTTAA